MVAGDLLPLLACPVCAGPIDDDGSGVTCARCGRTWRLADGIVDLRREIDSRGSVLRDFYSAAPFPGYRSRDTFAALRWRARRSEFARLLDEAIPPDATVLDVGCGTGQMTLFLSTGDRLVVGADLTRASLLLAVAAARRFNVERVHFVETDLRSPGLRAGAFDVVYCSGVLHHTPDPRESFRSIARLVRPGGVIVVGVYNAYARIPHRIRAQVARWTGVPPAALDAVLRDRRSEPARREAWLRDQYQHPEEHRHTIREVQSWFHDAGADYLRSYPSTLSGEPPLGFGALFTAAGDDWAFENVLQQVRWAFTLGSEGGLFVAVGRMPLAPGTGGGRPARPSSPMRHAGAIEADETRSATRSARRGRQPLRPRG